jgi:hypothetical protein
MGIDLRPYYRTQKRGKLSVTYVPWADLCHVVNQARLVWQWDVEILQVPGHPPALKGVLRVLSTDGQREVTRCAVAPIEFDGQGGNPWEEAESAAFRRCWAKFGVGLELWRRGEEKNGPGV